MISLGTQNTAYSRSKYNKVNRKKNKIDLVTQVSLQCKETNSTIT